MNLTVNHELVNRIKNALTRPVCINMRRWAEDDYDAVDFVTEIRKLRLFENCGTTACIGGLACYLATDDEIAGVVGKYDLDGFKADHPEYIAAGLLLDGHDSIDVLCGVCDSLFHLMHWPPKEYEAYNNSKTSTERVRVVLRRLNNWVAEVEARSAK